MKIEDYRQMSDKELQESLSENRSFLNTLIYRHGVSPIENPTRIRTLRKDIARILTVVNERRCEKELQSVKI